MGKKIRIELLVNTEKIAPGKVDENVKIIDSSGGESGKDLKKFTTDVALKNAVVWSGTPEEKKGGDKVYIKEIKYEEGTLLFKHKNMKGNRGKVRGLVVHGIKDDTEKYAIEFEVKREGKRTRYSIDPIIRVDPKD